MTLESSSSTSRRRRPWPGPLSLLGMVVVPLRTLMAAEPSHSPRGRGATLVLGIGLVLRALGLLCAVVALVVERRPVWRFGSVILAAVVAPLIALVMNSNWSRGVVSPPAHARAGQRGDVGPHMKPSLRLRAPR